MIRKNKCNNNNLSTRGMTLIELLIVVAVIGILGAIAYPSYTSHIIKSHRITALADMSKIQLELESRYEGNYASAAVGVMSGGSCSFCDTDTSRYTLAIINNGVSYAIQATPLAAQVNDECLGNDSKITLEHSGASKPKACWN